MDKNTHMLTPNQTESRAFAVHMLIMVRFYVVHTRQLYILMCKLETIVGEKK